MDKQHGCCGNSEDTIDLRRITDLKYRASPIWTLCCCCRGTLVVYAADTTDSEVKINTWGTRQLYYSLKDAWGSAKANVAVETDTEVA
eukprot:CAMPEP_0119302078 /NCGR_PEP_ID=MMETSP1333-20130426/3746_1 /TAXON_ID=418940 /ORGANISM="Scyphosphaera apsteinii, Strain RCC1455" /LENGTH=87 /DNA_ID=CAMNT_0007304325 /DNA_START=283 /DNA_END=546 /DNA_ORIENTATION=+